MVGLRRDDKKIEFAKSNNILKGGGTQKKIEKESAYMCGFHIS